MSLKDIDSYVLSNFNLYPVRNSEVAYITVSRGRISKLDKALKTACDLKVIDLQGLNLSSGFIDLQLNGCGGVSFNNDISIETLDIMHDCNLKSGCTSFLPTLISSSDEDMVRAIEVVRRYKNNYPDRVPGLHMEGPYLNAEKKGIHDQQFIRQPDPVMIDYICLHSDVVSMITLAPEVCSSKIIRQLSDAGIVVAIGHTDATYEQVQEAEKAGASFATHLYNAMSAMNSREPGLVGAVLGSETLEAGIIADGYHLAWNSLKIAEQLLQDRLVLVTDATAAAGTTLKEFDFAGQKIFHKEGKCINQDGTLGGSALTMIKAIINCIDQGIDQNKVINMATQNPARILGKSSELGAIAIGQYANLAIFDSALVINGAVSGGQLHLFHRPGDNP